MDYERMTSPCGRDCFNCPVFIASGNEKLKKAMAHRLGIPEDSVDCKGCRDEEGKCKFLGALGFAEGCRIYDCVSKKGVKFCFECSEFPCDLLHPLADMADRFPHNMKVFNLCRIARVGVEKWATEEAKASFDRYYAGKLESCVGRKGE